MSIQLTLNERGFIIPHPVEKSNSPSLYLTEIPSAWLSTIDTGPKQLYNKAVVFTQRCVLFEKVVLLMKKRVLAIVLAVLMALTLFGGMAAYLLR